MTNDEMALGRYADQIGQLAQEAAGQRVALVGNARALALGAQGEEIDSADLVVRLNRAPRASTVSHGRRLDWVITSVPLAPATLVDLAPARVIWASSKRKRLRLDLARHEGFALVPGDLSARLMRQLRARPSTGMIALAKLARLPVAEITLYGFDFFQSRSLSGHRCAAHVPHDFAAEARLIAQMAAQDHRLVIRRVPQSPRPVSDLLPSQIPLPLT